MTTLHRPALFGATILAIAAALIMVLAYARLSALVPLQNVFIPAVPPALDRPLPSAPPATIESAFPRAATPQPAAAPNERSVPASDTGGRPAATDATAPKAGGITPPTPAATRSPITTPAPANPAPAPAYDQDAWNQNAGGDTAPRRPLYRP